MKLRIGIVAVAAVAVSLTLEADENRKPRLGKAPLTADAIAVYRAFLAQYDNGAPGQVNLADRTVALEVSEHDQGCVKGIEFEDLAEAQSRIHRLSPDVFAENKKVRLVDPKVQMAEVKRNDPGEAIRRGKRVEDAVGAGFAAGYLELSEIAFDKSHRQAVLTYGFYCGALCGHGGILVFENVGGQWKRSKRVCSEWIS